MTVPTIESLDLRDNLIKALPEDLSRLNNLKNFSIRENSIKKLPICIGKMSNLQRLTTRSNPIKFPEKVLWRVRDRNGMSEDEEKKVDIQETMELKKIFNEYGSRRPSRHDHSRTGLLYIQAVKAHLESETNSVHRDMTLETPRPPRRQASGRFPIRPSVSSIDMSAAALPPIYQLPTKNDPIFNKNNIRLPPTPVSAVRPGIDPLALDERMRSHSESHMSTSKRKKRMGIQMSRSGKGSNELNLDSLNMPQESTEHNRGLSNGSTTAFGSGTETFANSSGSASPTHQDPPRSALLSRLSSLPESKRKSTFHDPYVELVQGISFSMEQVHGPVKQLINLIKSAGAKSRSLERYCFTALTSMNMLNKKVQQMQMFDEEKDDFQTLEKGQRASSGTVQEACGECISSFEVLIEALMKEVRVIVERANPRIVRTLIHLLFGSSVELRNAYAKFASHFGTSPKIVKATHQSNTSTITAINGNGHTSPVPRPTTSLRIKDRDRRTRNESMTSDLDKPLPQPRIPYSPYNGSISYTGSTLASDGSFVNNNAYGQSGQLPYTPSLTPSASFTSASTYAGLDGFEFYDEDQQFEFIFQKLQIACETSIQTLTKTKLMLDEVHRRTVDNHAPEAHISTAKVTCVRCKYALEAAGDVSRHLSTVRMHETQTRKNPEFWQACTALTRVCLYPL